jgi:hypothetical protein
MSASIEYPGTLHLDLVLPPEEIAELFPDLWNEARRQDQRGRPRAVVYVSRAQARRYVERFGGPLDTRTRDVYWHQHPVRTF